MTLRGMVVALMTTSACYSPSFQDCELQCAGTSCPDGLTCESGVCRLPGRTGACQAPTDTGPCFPFSASNVDACEPGFPATVGPLTLLAGAAQTIDTTTPVLGVPYLAGRVIVLHVDAMTIENGATLTVTGARPLIIVSDGLVDINGTITVEPTTIVPADCMVAGARSTSSIGTGGGGGGYGTAGGIGGGTVTLPMTTPGGVVNGQPALVPLRPGCPGGNGGGPTTAGSGGAGGGALQITSGTEIIVAGGGTILAGGNGGGGGKAATCSGLPCTSGGGGGGTGGSILLEANRVEVRQLGRVCAVGAAGGNGPRSTSPMASGSPGGDPVLCTGGRSGNVGLPGGVGAEVMDLPGGDGTGGSSNSDSGAGGGGGLGRIRIRAIESRLVMGNVVPAPAP